MNIVLTGFMATGKTEISKAISEISKYNLVDTDDMIVEQEGITINEIFDKCGEEYFRKTECEVIKKAAEMKNVVIATGGGVVQQNMKISIFNLSPDFQLYRTQRIALEYAIIHQKRFVDRKPFLIAIEDLILGQHLHKFRMSEMYLMKRGRKNQKKRDRQNARLSDENSRTKKRDKCRK